MNGPVAARPYCLRGRWQENRGWRRCRQQALGPAGVIIGRAGTDPLEGFGGQRAEPHARQADQQIRAAFGATLGEAV